MIINDYQELSLYASFLEQPDESVFEKMKTEIESVEYRYRNEFFGERLFLKLENNVLLKRLIAEESFFRSIPALDIIITNNGFSISNTNNIAPASKERVERLMNRSEKKYLSLLDDLISYILSSEILSADWADTIFYDLYTKKIYWHSKFLRLFGGVTGADRNDLAKLEPAIFEISSILSDRISTVLFDKIVDQGRKLYLPSLGITGLIYRIVGMYIQKGITPAVELEISNLENYLEKHLSEFPEYEQSEIYQSKKMNYENNAESPVFFS